MRATTAPESRVVPDDLDPADPDLPRRGLLWLTNLRQDPRVRAAFAAASPDLLDALDALEAGEADGRRILRLVAGTSRYLLRWQHRATPFALFAGVGSVHRAPTTKVRWGDDHRIVRRPDPEWLGEMVDRLHACAELMERLTVAANTAAVHRGTRLVVPAPPAGAGTDAGTAAIEVSVRAGRPVAVAMKAAQTPVTFAELVKVLTGAFPTAPADRIRTMVSDLVAQHFLMSALHPPMATDDPLGHVCAVLHDIAAHDIPAAAEHTHALTSLHRELRTPQAFPRAASVLAPPCTAPIPLTRDTVLDAHLDLPVQVAEEAAKAAAVLCRLSPYPLGTASWRDHHARFVAQYGTGLAVPVLDVVSDAGPGYPAGYLGSGRRNPLRVWTARDERLLALVQEALLEGDELVLTDATVDELADDRDAFPPWPDRVEIGLHIHAASTADIDRKRFMLSIAGTPRAGSSMIGRHAHLLPKDSRARLAATYQAADPDTIAAQLSFPPRLRRNASLAASTPSLGHLVSLAEHPPAHSGEAAPRPISVSELAVSADADRFHLLHTPSGRRVKIRVAHALEATTHIPPLARFLSEISTARGTLYTAFDFGAASRLPRLPRVRYRRTILAPARWLLPTRALPAPSVSADVWQKALAEWRRRWSVPARVALVEHDRRLPLDLSLPLHRHILRTRLNRARRLELHENNTDDRWFGRAHQILLPLTLSTQPTTSSPRPTPPQAGTRPLKTTAVLSSRLSAHPDRWDEILIEHLPRLLNAFRTAPLWWFQRHENLRYPDRIGHLLLHFHLPSGDDHGLASTRLTAWASDLVEQNLANALSVEAFRPRSGQYGHGPALQAAHTVFASDSQAALAQIDLATRTGIPPLALTATSMIDLAIAFAGAPERAARILVDELPRARGGLDTTLRNHTLRLTDRTFVPRAITELPRCDTVIEAWRQRARDLDAYRRALETERDPMSVLTVLLHNHHRRTCGSANEQTTLRLARACALRDLHAKPR
ncbi:lantibiotic dehydratase [Embleya sp. NPDC059259]|uniref:lantibiotic dehydratase n=1 Tax=unclassified Embleya TaxID=2699296 RepID=UPI003690FD7A